MEPKPTRVNIVHLLEPNLCLSCRFASIARLEQPDGTIRSLLRCRRLDCDNWQTQESDPIPHSFNDGS